MNIEGNNGTADAEIEDYNNNPPTDNNSSLGEDSLTLNNNKRRNKNFKTTIKGKNRSNLSQLNDRLGSHGKSFYTIRLNFFMLLGSSFNTTINQNTLDADSSLCIEQARGASPLNSHYNVIFIYYQL